MVGRMGCRVLRSWRSSHPVVKGFVLRNFAGVCAAVIVLGLPVALHAQLNDLPLKPGLWETQVSLNHGASMAGKVCFTAGTTLADYLTATNKSAGAQCSVTNKVATAHGLAFDNVCTNATMSTKGHIDFQLADSEHFSGSSHTTVSGTAAAGKPVNMTLDKTFTAKFVGADCGAVKPVVVPGSGK